MNRPNYPSPARFAPIDHPIHTKLFLLKSSLSAREIDTKIPAIIILLALLSVASIHIGHGLTGDLNPHETGAIVMESYFNPNRSVFDNY